MNHSLNKSYDAVVVGAGINGLVAAAYLAKQGKKVLCLEKNSWLGGVSARAHKGAGPVEPGLQVGVARISQSVIQDLKLNEHGLKLVDEYPVEFIAVGGGQSKSFKIWLGNDQKTADEIAKVNSGDAKRYLDFMKEVHKFAPIVRDLALSGGGSVFPRSAGQSQSKSFWDVLRLAARVRGLGAKDMHELMRVIPLSASDWLAEYFQDDFIKASFASRAAFDNYSGPMGPGTAFQLLLAECHDDPMVASGASGLVAALVRAGEQYGVTFETNAQVTKLGIEDDAVTKVSLNAQQEISCDRVYATMHPHELFYQLIDPVYLTMRHEEAMGAWRSRGVTAVARVAVKQDKSILESSHKVLIPDGKLFGVEKAFDAIKYQKAAQSPVIEIEVSKNGSMVTLFIHGVSTLLNSEEERARLRSLSAQVIANHVTETVDAGDVELSLPIDIAEQFHSPGGHLWQGETAIDQIVVRPHPDFCSYHTPIKGLYLCGRATQGGTALGWPAMKAVLA